MINLVRADTTEPTAASLASSTEDINGNYKQLFTTYYSNSTYLILPKKYIKHYVYIQDTNITNNSYFIYSH